MKAGLSFCRFVWPSVVAVVVTFAQLTAAQPAVPAAEAAPAFFHYSVSSGSAVIPGVQVLAGLRKNLGACMHARDACAADAMIRVLFEAHPLEDSSRSNHPHRDGHS